MKNAALFSVVALALAPVPAIAGNIDTTGGLPVSDYWFPFGSDGSGTATYGQTFTPGAGDTALQSFSLFLGDRFQGADALSFKGYVAGWDGSKATSILYSSGVLNHSGTPSEYLFNTGGLALTPGNMYVAFLSVSDLGAQPLSSFYMPRANNPLSGGSFVFFNNGTDFSALTNSAWDGASWFANDDAAFKAVFGQSGVPEPATWAMMILGMGAIGFAMRRQRRQTKVGFAF